MAHAGAIEIRNLTKTFGRDTKALDGVTFSVEPGEMVALIGASGSGKSTLIRHIAGLVQPDAGVRSEITVNGAQVQSNGRIDPRIRAVRTQVGMVSQQFNLVPRLSLLTNVCLGALGRIPKWRGNLALFPKEERVHAMDALDRVGMARFAGQRSSTLSGGQQQRGAVARALVQGAQVLLADEPIASLDPRSARSVMKTIASLNAEDGMSVLVSLHQVDYAVRFCPRTIAMSDGRIIFDGPSRELTPSFLQELYGERSDEVILGSATALDEHAPDNPKPHDPASPELQDARVMA